MLWQKRWKLNKVINKQISDRAEDGGWQSLRERGMVNRELGAKLPGLHNGCYGVERKQVMSKRFFSFTAEWRERLFPEVDVGKDWI